MENCGVQLVRDIRDAPSRARTGVCRALHECQQWLCQYAKAKPYTANLRQWLVCHHAVWRSIQIGLQAIVGVVMQRGEHM